MGDPFSTLTALLVQAVRTLGTKLDDQGRIIVERPNRNLAHLQLCTRGQPSVAATARYREILDNLRR